MTVTDTTGGVDVKVSLDAATLFASTGGGHVTIAWNTDPASVATTIKVATLTFDAVTGASPPGCETSCGTFSNGIQGTSWSGTGNGAPAGPITFFLAGVTTADFTDNADGFMAAVDVLGPKGTGEVAGTGTISSVPEPSTWAMMFLGFAGLAFVGFRKAKTARTAFSAV